MFSTTGVKDNSNNNILPTKQFNKINKSQITENLPALEKKSKNQEKTTAQFFSKFFPSNSNNNPTLVRSKRELQPASDESLSMEIQEDQTDISEPKKEMSALEKRELQAQQQLEAGETELKRTSEEYKSAQLKLQLAEKQKVEAEKQFYAMNKCLHQAQLQHKIALWEFDKADEKFDARRVNYDHFHRSQPGAAETNYEIRIDQMREIQRQLEFFQEKAKEAKSDQYRIENTIKDVLQTKQNAQHQLEQASDDLTQICQLIHTAKNNAKKYAEEADSFSRRTSFDPHISKIQDQTVELLEQAAALQRPLIERLKQKVHRQAEHLKKLQEEMAEAIKDESEANQYIQKYQDALPKAQEEVEKTKQWVYSARKEEEQASKELDIARETQDAAKQQKESAQQELEKVKAQLNTAQKDFEKAQQDLVTAKAEAAALQEHMEKAQQYLREAREQLTETQKQRSDSTLVVADSIGKVQSLRPGAAIAEEIPPYVVTLYAA